MQRAFILGNPRSGTSLLRLMLNSHPRMSSPPESGFLHWWYGKYSEWKESDSKSAARVADFVSDLLQSKKIETWKLDQEEIVKFILKHKPIDYGALGNLVYLFWSMAGGKVPEVIIDKNNYYIHYLEDIQNIWPDAKFIFLLRDGRDVALSYLDLQKLESQSPYKPNLPVTISEIANEWTKNNLNIYEFLTKLPRERWQLIKYEDLVTSTRSVLTGTTSFLDVEFSEQMLLYYQMNDEPSSTLDWKKKTLEKPDESNIGKYKAKLTMDEIKVFNKIAHQVLTIGGYEE